MQNENTSVTVMVVGPGRKVQILYAKPDFRTWNYLVNGSISMLRLPQELREQGFAAYCDDNAIASGQEPNGFATHLGHWRLLGPIVLFRDDGSGDEKSLSTEDARTLARYFSSPPTHTAQGEADADRAFWAAHPSGMAFASFDNLEDMYAALGWKDEDA